MRPVASISDESSRDVLSSARIQAHLQAIRGSADPLKTSSLTTAAMLAVQGMPPHEHEHAFSSAPPAAAAQAPLAAASVESVQQPQFSMLTLMLVVTFFGVLCAVMQFLGPWWSALLSWFGVLAAAHVAANAWGSQLGRRMGGGLLPGDRPTIHQQRAAIETALVPSTFLRREARLGKAHFYLVIGASVVGAVVGSLAMLALGLEKTGVGGLILGTCSLAVVGGFVGFVVSSFVQVAGRAMREAADSSRG